MKERPSCSNCYYFKAHTEATGMHPGKDWGECHRRSPNASRHFPNVLPDDFCGDHPDYVMWALDRKLENNKCLSASSGVHYTTECLKSDPSQPSSTGTTPTPPQSA